MNRQKILITKILQLMIRFVLVNKTLEKELIYLDLSVTVMQIAKYS